MISNDNKLAPSRGRRPVVLWLPTRVPPLARKSIWALSMVLVGHLASSFLSNPGMASAAGVHSFSSFSDSRSLYLIDHARPHIRDIEAFASRVIDVAEDLLVPPEWLMAVMYAESKFDPGIANLQGSGATGLIQFMPATAAELGISIERLKRMDAVQQMEYVFLYLQRVRDRYGDYDSLTDLYLGILYPKARGQDFCFTLFAKPSVSYQQNRGLDQDNDGRVTISDVDRHLRGLFPDAYILSNGMDQGIR
ncbi:MAG: transglycosylase SLT domain-containing protein [Bacteroidia bacterium]|nr:transglycosylase SLT domain-containing protein [Bacteroidia bacterium]